MVLAPHENAEIVHYVTVRSSKSRLKKVRILPYFSGAHPMTSSAVFNTEIDYNPFELLHLTGLGHSPDPGFAETKLDEASLILYT